MEKDVFSKKEEDFPKKFKKFKFFTWGLNWVLWRIATSVSACIRKARSPRVWSDRACGAVRLKNESVCQKRDAPLHPVMECASPTQECFGATRRWWCDLSHGGPLRTLVPSSMATVVSVFILAMILCHKEQSSFRLPGCHHFAKASDC